MGNVQATASHDDNTDNNDNYVEDDIDKKDNTGQLYPRNARFLFFCTNFLVLNGLWHTLL